jgi:dihydroorotate dehydrogenase electron transfer subunit
MQLALRGPLGNGFRLPKRLKRLALLALDGEPARLLPLLPEARQRDLEVALFTETGPTELPLNVEVQPLSALSRIQAWADFVAVDISIERLDSLVEHLGTARSLKGQALVAAPMPCGGLAQCGICTLNVGKREKLICEEGPVFALSDLLS